MVNPLLSTLSTVYTNMLELSIIFIEVILIKMRLHSYNKLIVIFTLLSWESLNFPSKYQSHPITFPLFNILLLLPISVVIFRNHGDFHTLLHLVF